MVINYLECASLCNLSKTYDFFILSQITFFLQIGLIKCQYFQSALLFFISLFSNGFQIFWSDQLGKNWFSREHWSWVYHKIIKMCIVWIVQFFVFFGLSELCGSRLIKRSFFLLLASFWKQMWILLFSVINWFSTFS